VANDRPRSSSNPVPHRTLGEVAEALTGVRGTSVRMIGPDSSSHIGLLAFVDYKGQLAFAVPEWFAMFIQRLRASVLGVDPRSLHTEVWGIETLIPGDVEPITDAEVLLRMLRQLAAATPDAPMQVYDPVAHVYLAVPVYVYPTVTGAWLEVVLPDSVVGNLQLAFVREWQRLAESGDPTA
jgi:hypothetical protein